MHFIDLLLEQGAHDGRGAPVDAPVAQQVDKTPAYVPPQQASAPAMDPKDAEIADLLAKLEAAQQDDRRSAHRQRAREYGLRAGQAVSSAIGGLPVTETGPMTKVPEKSGDQAELIKNKMQLEKHNQDLAKSKAETERIGTVSKLNNQKYDVGSFNLDNLQEMSDPNSPTSKFVRDAIQKETGIEVPEVLSGQDAINARPEFRGIVQSAQQRYHESQSNYRAEVVGRYGLGKAAMAQEASAGTAAGKANFEADKEQATRQVTGEAPGMVHPQVRPLSQNDHKNATELQSDYMAFREAVLPALKIMKASPRNFWGTDAHAKLTTALIEAAQSKNKINQNGVMNPHDMQSIIAAMGDPDSFEHWLTGNGIAKLEQDIAISQQKYIKQMLAHGIDVTKDVPVQKMPDANSVINSSRHSGPVTGPDALPKLDKFATDRQDPMLLPPKAEGSKKKFTIKMVNGKPTPVEVK